VDYEWDEAKSQVNRRKHGVAFADSVAALQDPNRIEEIDARFDYGEERTQVIGMAQTDVLCVIVTQRSENICRIISARRAIRHEEDWYYAGDRQAW
jgi:hypothetical protein